MQYATVPGAPNGLLVNDIATGNEEHDGLWKVSYVHDETPYVLSDLAFVRRSDAERARAAIAPIVDWTRPMDDVIAQIRQHGWTRKMVRQMMLEALQW